MSARLARRCEFRIGRAGSGKTYGCLAAIAAELRRAPRGAPLLFLVPEQASAQMERRLATWPGLMGGFTRARVLSFAHLAREALDHPAAWSDSDTAPAPTLSPTGRVLLVRRALARLDGLQVFGATAATRAGHASTLAATIEELQRYGWTPGALESWLADHPDETKQQSHLARKLNDLARIWRDYEAALARGGWRDPEARWTEAAALMSRLPELTGAHVWVDGFSSFTAMEMGLLEALLNRATGATIALCADPAALAAGRPRRTRIGAERLFENAEDTLHLLESQLGHLGWETTRRPLPSPDQPIRFVPDLAHLESNVLDRLSTQPHSGPTEAVEFIEAADRRAELETVARRIVAACRRPTPEPEEAGVTWRDFAVLARDLEPYDALVREVFAQFEIPCFIDRPRRIHAHPLTRLITSALAFLRSRASGRAALHYLKSGLIEVAPPEMVALIEQHIRSVSLDNRTWRDNLDPRAEGTIGALSRGWIEVEMPLRRLAESLRAAENPAHALAALLEDTGARERLEGWITEARREGREEDAQLHAQAWQQTVGWLEELGAVLTADAVSGESELGEHASYLARVDVLAELVEAALSAVEARLVPPTLNQVTVGSVDRSRTPEVRTVFVIGMIEGEFPVLWTPDPVLGDEERATLEESGKRLGPDSRARRLQEHYLAYIALTRAAERVVLSRPRVGDDGRPAVASPVFSRVADAFPEAPRWSPDRAGVGDDPALPLREEELALRTSTALAAAGTARGDAVLAGLLKAGDLARRREDAAWRSLTQGRREAWAPTPARISPELAHRYWQRRGRISLTALQQFGECPFRFHASQVLRLEDPAAPELSPLDLGTIRHDLLHDLYLWLKDQSPAGWVDWGALEPEAADRRLNERLEAMTRDPLYASRLEASGLERAGLRNLARDMRLVVRALKMAGEVGGFVQTGAEWDFGRERELVLAAGDVELSVVGRVDRIDTLVRDGKAAGPIVIYDYKSGNREANVGLLLGGVDVQLAGYALAVAGAAGRGDGRRVAGFFYWPLAAPFTAASGGGTPDDEGPIDAAWFASRRPKGLIDESIADDLDATLAAEGKSAVYGMRHTNKGVLVKSAVHWPADRFERILKHARAVLDDAARRIVSGEIALHPSRRGRGTAATACAHCPAGPVCRVEMLERVPYRAVHKVRGHGATAELIDGPLIGVAPS